MNSQGLPNQDGFAPRREHSEECFWLPDCRHRCFGRWPRGFEGVLRCNAGRQRHGVRDRPAPGSDPREPDGGDPVQVHDDEGRAGRERHSGAARWRIHQPARQGLERPQRPVGPGQADRGGPCSGGHRPFPDLPGGGSGHKGHLHHPVGQQRIRRPVRRPGRSVLPAGCAWPRSRAPRSLRRCPGQPSDTGLVDYVLPPGQMSAPLLEFAQYPQVLGADHKPSTEEGFRRSGGHPHALAHGHQQRLPSLQADHGRSPHTASHGTAAGRQHGRVRRSAPERHQRTDAVGQGYAHRSQLVLPRCRRLRRATGPRPSCR